jgi:hypothetical protein
MHASAQSSPAWCSALLEPERALQLHAIGAGAANVLNTKADSSKRGMQMARPDDLVLKLAAVLLLAGCQTQPAQDSPAKSPAAQNPAVTPSESPPVAIKPVPQEAPQAQASPPAKTSPPQAAPPAAAPAASTTAPSAAAPLGPAPSKPSAGATKAAPKNSAAPTAPETKPAVAAAPSAPPKPAPLDLNSLEQRLKDTRAIGVFTKLSLKNQVDDLLSELRDFHKGSAKMSQSVLRQKYDLLIIKVLSLLQDGDPPLAMAISSSREAIWGILMDPEKFAKI